MTADISLTYQPTSWEYIQFLGHANDGSVAFIANEGVNILDAWLNTGMATPHAMALTTWTVPDTDGDGISDFDEINHDGNPAYDPAFDINPLSNNTDADAYADNVDPVPLDFYFEDGDVAPWGAPDSQLNAADLLVCIQFVLAVKVPTNMDLAHGDLYPVGAPCEVIGLPDYLQLQKVAMAQ